MAIRTARVDVRTFPPPSVPGIETLRPSTPIASWETVAPVARSRNQMPCTAA